MGKRFLAVVPDGLQDNLELRALMTKLRRTLKERGQEARWVAPDLWHVTLQFLDPATPADQVDDLFLKWRPPLTEFTLRLQGIGAFPSSLDARVLWVGVKENQDLLDLQADLARQLGVANPERPYHPHLTLARFRNAISAQKLIELGGRKHFGDYNIRELVLFESVLEGNILKYVARRRAPLQ